MHGWYAWRRCGCPKRHRARAARESGADPLLLILAGRPPGCCPGRATFKLKAYSETVELWQIYHCLKRAWVLRRCEAPGAGCRGLAPADMQLMQVDTSSPAWEASRQASKELVRNHASSHDALAMGLIGHSAMFIGVTLGACTASCYTLEAWAAQHQPASACSQRFLMTRPWVMMRRPLR